MDTLLKLITLAGIFVNHKAQAAEYYKDIWGTSVRVNTSGFSNNENRTINRALTFISNRLEEMYTSDRSNYWDCAKRYDNYSFDSSYPKYENIVYATGEVLGRLNDGINISAYYDRNASHWGKARRTSRGISIKLNRAKLQSHTSSASWGALIFHEALHNVGLKHSSNARPSSTPMSQIYKMQGCFKGRSGFSLAGAQPSCG